MSLLQHAPTFSSQAACEMATQLYGLQVDATPLPSERDQNFRLVTNSGEQFVLKIANALENIELLEAQNLILDHLSRHVSFCPRVIPTQDGRAIQKVHGTHFARLITYLPGKPLGELPRYTKALLNNLGHKLGQLDRALATFDHPSFHRDFHWDLANGPRVVQEHGQLIRNEELKRIVTSINDQFGRQIRPLLPQLRTSIIHGDANDYNLLVDEHGKLSGIVDFGDMVHSFTIAELAIASAYVLLRAEEPLGSLLTLVRGYQREFPVTDPELDALWPLIMLRLCMSVSLAAYQRQQQPANDYLNISQEAINFKLPQLAKLNWSSVAARLK